MTDTIKKVLVVDDLYGSNSIWFGGHSGDYDVYFGYDRVDVEGERYEGWRNRAGSVLHQELVKETNGSATSLEIIAGWKRIADRHPDKLRKMTDEEYIKRYEKDYRKIPTTMENETALLKSAGYEISYLLAEPFDTATVLPALQGQKYDVLLLDLGFPIAECDKDTELGKRIGIDNAGGVYIGYRLQEQGKKFTFWTHDYGHARDNIECAMKSGLLALPQVRDVEGRAELYQRDCKNFDHRWPAIISSKGNLALYGKQITEGISKERVRLFRAEEFLKLVKAADAYQNR